MRIVFMGSAGIACPSLDAVLDSALDEVALVVTQPDRPKGRKRKVTSCPLKSYALKKGVPVLSPERIGEASAVEALRKTEPDIIVLVAFGQYITQDLLNLPPKGAVNLHPSLLPKYRGAAPIQRAIADGCEATGVTTMYMSEKMDAGDIILQEKVAIAPDDTGVSLTARLAEEGGGLIKRTLDLLRDDAAPREAQDEHEATYAPKLTKDDGRVDWSKPARRIHDEVRAFQPWPVCYCTLPSGTASPLRIYRTAVEVAEGEPGEIIESSGDGPLIAAGEGALRLLEVQPPGKQPMPGKAFLCGHDLQPGQTMK